MVVRNPDEIIYPSSDGKPMAENTVQYRWITIIKGGMDVVFKDDPNVFIAGDLLWYPVEGKPTINAAPDTMLVFGRPKGDRMSYLQWREENLPPQVVFEVFSPSNTESDKAAKVEWYEQYGVEEYYAYDPDRLTLQGWVRKGSVLRGVPGIRDGFTSPRTGVRLRMDRELVLLGPDGKAFVDYPALAEQRDEFERSAQAERQRADDERQRADDERQRADDERQRLVAAEKRVSEESKRAGEEARRAEEALRLANEQTRRATAEAERAEIARRERDQAEMVAIEERRLREEERARAEQARRQAETQLETLKRLLRERGVDPDSFG